MKIAMTGTTGLIGSVLSKHFVSQGNELFSLQRKSGADHAIPFELGKEVAEKTLGGFDALIHCAHDFSVTTPEENQEKNVQGSIQLLQTAKKAGVRKIIFISTVSSFEGCTSYYGQGKLEVEKALTAMGGISLRLGMVYGNVDRGIYVSLKKISSLPVIPLFDGGIQMLAMVKLEDAVIAIDALLKADTTEIKPSVITVAESHLISFKELLKHLKKTGGQSIFFNLPSALVLFGLKIFETLGVKLPFRSDGLKTLLKTNVNIDLTPAQQLGIQPASSFLKG